MEGQFFPQSAAGILSEEPSLQPIPAGNYESSPEGPELVVPSTTGNLRAPVVLEIQASPRELGLLPTSDRSGSLDQDSTFILPGKRPRSPSKWQCDPHSETLSMAENRLLTSVAAMRTSSQSTQRPSCHAGLSSSNTTTTTNYSSYTYLNSPTPKTLLFTRKMSQYLVRS